MSRYSNYNFLCRCVLFCVCLVCEWVFQCGRLYNYTVYKYITLPFFIRFSNFILFNVPELYQCSPPWLCPLLLPREILEVQRRKGWLFKRRKKGNFFSDVCLSFLWSVMITWSYCRSAKEILHIPYHSISLSYPMITLWEGYKILKPFQDLQGVPRKLFFLKRLLIH